MTLTEFNALTARCARLERILAAIQRKLASQTLEQLDRAEVELEAAIKGEKKD